MSLVNVSAAPLDTQERKHSDDSFSLVLSSRLVIKDFSGIGVESITKRSGVF